MSTLVRVQEKQRIEDMQPPTTVPAQMLRDCVMFGVKLSQHNAKTYNQILLHLSNKCTIYTNNVCFVKHCYMFRCLYIIGGVPYYGR